jgi:hypothetical protein
MMLAKRPQFLLFSNAQVRNEYLRSYLNCCTVQLQIENKEAL